MQIDRKSGNLGSGSQRHRGGRESKVGGIATAQNRHCHHLRLLQNVSRVKGLETLLKLPVKKLRQVNICLTSLLAFKALEGPHGSPEALGLVDRAGLMANTITDLTQP